MSHVSPRSLNPPLSRGGNRAPALLDAALMERRVLGALMEGGGSSAACRRVPLFARLSRTPIRRPRFISDMLMNRAAQRLTSRGLRTPARTKVVIGTHGDASPRLRSGMRTVRRGLRSGALSSLVLCLQEIPPLPLMPVPSRPRALVSAAVPGGGSSRAGPHAVQDGAE